MFALYLFSQVWAFRNFSERTKNVSVWIENMRLKLVVLKWRFRAPSVSLFRRCDCVNVYESNEFTLPTKMNERLNPNSTLKTSNTYSDEIILFLSHSMFDCIRNIYSTKRERKHNEIDIQKYNQPKTELTKKHPKKMFNSTKKLSTNRICVVEYDEHANIPAYLCYF